MCFLCRKTHGLWVAFLVTRYTPEVTVNWMNSTFSIVHYNQSVRWTDTRKNSGPFLCSWGPNAGLGIIGFWVNSQSLVQWFVKMMPQDQHQGSQLSLYITETCWWPSGTLTLGQFNSSARVFKTCYFRHHELYLEHVKSVFIVHCIRFGIPRRNTFRHVYEDVCREVYLRRETHTERALGSWTKQKRKGGIIWASAFMSLRLLSLGAPASRLAAMVDGTSHCDLEQTLSCSGCSHQLFSHKSDRHVTAENCKIKMRLPLGHLDLRHTLQRQFSKEERKSQEFTGWIRLELEDRNDLHSFQGCFTSFPITFLSRPYFYFHCAHRPNSSPVKGNPVDLPGPHCTKFPVCKTFQILAHNLNASSLWKASLSPIFFENFATHTNS